MRVDERAEVLARLKRRRGEDVPAAELGALALGRVARVETGVRDAQPLRLDAEKPLGVARRELRVREEKVTRPRRVPVLRAVHPHGLAVRPVRKPERDKVVDHRRADAVGLRRVHPVGEVQHVETADEALDRRGGRAAPRRPPGMREREHRQPPLDLEAVEGALDRSTPGPARGRPRHDLVVVGRRLDEPAERPEHVVADAGSLVGEGRHVEDDPHGE